MSFDDLRPVLSGIAGGAVAVWLGHRLSRWIPASLNGKTQERLLQEHRIAILVANVLAAAGFLGALSLYQWGGFARNDWRPIGLGFGLALTAPLIAVPAVSWIIGRSVSEGLVSYAVSQRMPIAVIYGLLLLGVPLLFVSIEHLL